MSESGETRPAGPAEILDPNEGPGDAGFTATILAQISNYTNRPDLLIAEIERHDPGFVRRMNAATELHAKEERSARFRFGRFQAYVALTVSAIAALGTIGLIALLIINGAATFGTIIAMGLVYAVTQGGASGFIKLIDAVVGFVKGRAKPEADE